ncbi:hypothetical protein HHK36_013827 [Tetracentron sinense]|uniref:Protein kinase domain-containing protein n=1 Tax=Tetracentron sinense TaxID=13715 RepID=A0A835DEJ2_TETSI|nr:hypothetical protein HHK36_013827 [Tetracentron sinense]
MADSHIFFLFILISICNLHNINSSTCTLDFKQFPYEAGGECIDTAKDSKPTRSMYSCCHSALQPIYQAMVMRANLSRFIFLDPTQAQDCSAMYQGIHNRTNLSNCRFQDFISSSTTNACSSDVNSVMDLLGIERYDDLRSSCRDLLMGNYSDDVCFNCVISYRRSLQALEEGNGGKVEGSNGRRVCAEALLVTLASSDAGSRSWVQGTFSCLWDEIEFSWPPQKTKGSLLRSKKLLAAILIALSLVIIALILYKITRKRLQYASQKEIENLSVMVLQKTLEDDSANPFSCSGLYIFSRDEVSRATDYFDSSSLIGEGNLGKMYIGIMPSGMRVAIKRINEGMKLHGFVGEICMMAKIRHPNLVTILGYCDKGDQCLVYEYCVNGDLARWLLGDQRAQVITWEQRLQIAIGIARGLWFLHNNPLEKMAHGDIKLTNILLNERLEAKISDSVLWNHKSKKMNELGTMANDVFNFGVVLLQLLTGRKRIDLSSSKPQSLINEARNIVSKGGSAYSMADPRLNGAYDPTTFQTVLLTAVLCTTASERERPNMEVILRKLQDTEALV